MMGIVLALLAALIDSLSVIFVRKRLDNSNFFSAVFVTTAIGSIIFWPLTLLFTSFRTVNVEGILFFAITGILAPGISRLCYFKGVDVVGVSVNASIHAAYPVYSSIFAALLLGEVIASENWIGIICVVVGVVFVQSSLSKSKAGFKRVRKGILFPMLASLTIATSYITRKYGLSICNEPLLGVAIGYSLSSFLYIIVLVCSGTARGHFSLSKDFRLFWKAGACLSFGWLLVFYALSYERVSIVTSLMQTQSLFVLFFSHLLLKESEHISSRLIIGTILVLIGVVFSVQ